MNRTRISLKKHLSRSFFIGMFATVVVALLLRTGITHAASLGAQNCGKWSIVPSPNPGAVSNALLGVAALSANNVWAVGYASSSSGSQTLVEHWDGTQWNVVASPNAAQYNGLGSVTAVSPNDIWAAGDYYSSNPLKAQTLIEHWDGTQWSVESSPSPGFVNELLGVTAVSANDVWAVGFLFNGNPPYTALIEHWDGTQWSVVTSPTTSAAPELTSLTAVAANNIWAVGFIKKPHTKDQAFIEHWDGIQWSIVKRPKIKGSALRGVSAVAANDIWTVGYHINSGGSGNNTLTEFYC